MKSEFTIPKELITHIDVMNTLNGGTAEPSLERKQYDSYREITLRIPGIAREQINVEINNNKLTAYYFTRVKSQDLEIPVPRVLYDKTIPYFVDIPNISVRDELGAMVIRLPFNDLSNGYHRALSSNN